MIKAYISLVDNNYKYIKHYIITIDDNVKGGMYRQLVSLNALFKHSYKTKTKGIQFECHLHVNDFKHILIRQENSVGVVLCKSIWDFYEKIKWNYKKKKFYIKN